MGISNHKIPIDDIAISYETSFKCGANKIFELMRRQGFVSGDSETVQIDLNDSERFTNIIAEYALFLKAIAIHAARKCIPDFSDKDRQKIEKAFPVVDQLLETLWDIPEYRSALSNRVDDYLYAIDNDLVCGSCAQNAIGFQNHKFVENVSRSDFPKCSFLFADFVYYIAQNKTFATLTEVQKVKEMASNENQDAAKSFMAYANAVVVDAECLVKQIHNDFKVTYHPELYQKSFATNTTATIPIEDAMSNPSNETEPVSEESTEQILPVVTNATKRAIKVKVTTKTNPKQHISAINEVANLQVDDSIEEVIAAPKVSTSRNETDRVIPAPNLSNPAIDNDPQQLHTDEKRPAHPSHKKWKPILFSAIGVLLAAVLTLLIIHFLPQKVDQHDINAIYGCPELSDIEFGTELDDVDSQIEIEHNTIMPHPLGDDEPMIMLDVDTEFELYGLPVQDFLCSFDDDKLEMVLFFFEKENVTYEQITKLYTKIYGHATSSDTSKTVWSGTKTTITIFADSEDDVYVVRYAETPNLRFTMLSFDGTEIDPCGFLSDNYVFDKTPSYYTTGLQKDKDYTLKQYSATGFPSFSKYALYPSFEYMGIESDYTAITFDVDDREGTIGIASYLFYLNQQNALDRMLYIKNALDQTYGQCGSCTYTSSYYSDMGIVDLTFNEMKSKISVGTQGLYNIQWEIDGHNITLGLTIKPNSTYYEGSVAFSLPGPHEHEYKLQSETAATCEKDGKKEYSCSCGETRTETIKAIGHNHTAKVTVATCTTQGYTTYTCSCGDSYVSNYTTASHNYQNYKCLACNKVDKANAAKYLEYWIKQNGTYDSETSEYQYIDAYPDDDLCYALSFSVAQDTIFLDRANILDGTLGQTIFTIDDNSYRTTFGSYCIKGTFSAKSFSKNSSVSYTAYECPENLVSTMADLAKISIVDTLNWLIWFLDEYDLGVTIADLGFEAY